MWHWSIWWLKYIALDLRIERWTFFQKGGFHDMKLQAMHHVLLIVNSNLLSSEFLSLASYHGNIFLSFIAHFHQFFSIIKFSSSFIILFFQLHLVFTDYPSFFLSLSILYRNNPKAAAISHNHLQPANQHQLPQLRWLYFTEPPATSADQPPASTTCPNDPLSAFPAPNYPIF